MCSLREYDHILTVGAQPRRAIPDKNFGTPPIWWRRVVTQDGRGPCMVATATTISTEIKRNSTWKWINAKAEGHTRSSVQQRTKTQGGPGQRVNTPKAKSDVSHRRVPLRLVLGAVASSYWMQINRRLCLLSWLWSSLLISFASCRGINVSLPPLPHPKLHMYSSLTPFLAPGGRMSLHRPTSLVTHIQKMETVSITKPPWTRFDDEPSVAGNPALDHINLYWANDLKGTDMRLIVVRIKAIGTFPAGFLHNPHIKNKHANNNSAPNCNQRHTFH